MVRKLTGLLIAVLGMMGLSGCVFGSVDEMYALPKSSEAYVNLQARINQEKGNAEYIAPLGGENRQTIQLVDIDGDGVQEAVAFFRDDSSENPLKIVIFKQDARESYQVHARIEGMGSEIESIDYLDLCGSEGSDLLVSWQVSASVHTLAGYAIDGGEPVEILRTGYDRYLAADLDQDGQQELAVTQPESGGAARWRVDYYDEREGRMELISSAPLSEGATDLREWSAGVLEGESPGLFVTSYFGKEALITDVFCVRGEGLENIALDKGLHRSGSVFRYAAGVSPRDMDGDGITEVPAARAIAAYGSSTGNFWWLDWNAYQPDGSRVQRLTTYHSSNGWYLDIPESWTGEFSMSSQESTAAGVHSDIFAQGRTSQEEDGSQPEPFLVISVLTGADRSELARQGKQFILHADNAAVYTGEFLDGWDCGLSEEDLEERFHLTTGS